ncbi:ABC transporter substrate-binding protein [Treponema sp. OttesenSCG-928-L16]|nr:ABC transporter substrate-binding protein [Treponema sp. OttesenSCG-928-L16]
MKKRTILVPAMALLLTALVFAGGKTEEASSAEAPAGGEKMAASQIYREGLLAAAQGQASFITTTAHRLDATVNEPLVALNWKGDLQPLIAERYEMQENGRVWMMYIRNNAKWHDGTDVTAADVIFSYSAYANPKVASRWNNKASSIKGYADVYGGKADRLSGVTAVNNKTVRIELSKPMPLWMKLEQTFLVIFPNHILGSVAPDQLVAQPYWRARVGTGPFIWEEYKPDQYIMLKRNENYYLGAPKLEKLVYTIFGDAASQLNALASGQIHTVSYESNLITPQEADTYEAMANISVLAMDKGAPSSISLNLRRPEWADKRVRQALRYAIDVKEIIKALYPGAIEAITLFPQTWTHPAGMNRYEYNPDLAKKLLAEAGWSGRTVDLVYVQPDALTQNLLLAIQQYWKNVGVTVNLRKIDAAATTALYASPEFDMGLGGSGMGLDPVVGELLIKKGELVSFGYDNPRVNELLDQGKNEADQAKRAPIYQEISKILNDEMPKIFLWYDIRHLGFNDKAIGPKDHWEEQRIIYFNQPIYNEIEKWYLVE